MLWIFSKGKPSHLTSLGAGSMHSPSTTIGCSLLATVSLWVRQCIRSILSVENSNPREVVIPLILTNASSKSSEFIYQELELTVICMCST